MFTLTDYALVIFNKNKGNSCHLHTTCHLRRLGFSQPRWRRETFLATMSPISLGPRQKCHLKKTTMFDGSISVRARFDCVFFLVFYPVLVFFLKVKWGGLDHRKKTSGLPARHWRTSRGRDLWQAEMMGRWTKNGVLPWSIHQKCGFNQEKLIFD